MKQLTFLILLIFTFLSVFAQEKSPELSHYLFPKFIKGTVLMVNGVKNESNLNYNTLTEEMIFENKEVKLALGRLDQIDTVFIEGRKFIPFENRFVELIYNGKTEVFADYKCRIKDPGTPAAYGGTSQTAATTTYSSYLSGGQVYALKLPENIEVNKSTEYFIQKDGQLNKFFSIKQLVKIFDNQNAVIKKYLKENKVKYENQDDILKLIRFIDLN